MAYQPLIDALARSQGGSKDMDRPVSGSTTHLPAGGPYDVVVVGVDTSALEEKGYVDFQYEDRETKAGHKGRVWLVDSRTGKLNTSFFFLLKAALNDAKAVDMFSDAMAAIGDNAFNLFRGMTWRISLRDGTGCKVHALGDGTYSIVDAESNQPLLADQFATIADADKEIKDRKIPKSWPRVSRTEPTSDEVANGNKEAFHLALKGISEAIERSNANQT